MVTGMVCMYGVSVTSNLAKLVVSSLGETIYYLSVRLYFWSCLIDIITMIMIGSVTL